MAERRSAASLFGGWAIYWIVVGAVKLGPAIAAVLKATSGPDDGKSSVALNYGDGGFALTVIERGVTTFSGSATLLELALWMAGPPLIWWVVWAMRRRKQQPVESRV
jgi:hypothetical protein